MMGCLLGLGLGIVLCLMTESGETPWFPDGHPNESHRVNHPAGFSMVAPEGWLPEVFDERESVSEYHRPNGIQFWPTKDRRYHPGFSVNQHTEKPMRALEGAKESVFQGKPSWKVERRADGASKYDAMQIIFERGTNWYVIDFFMPEGCIAPQDKLPPNEFEAYFDTFSTR